MVFVVVVIGYIVFQNSGRIFLILLSQHRLANLFQPASTVSSSNGKPPHYKDGSFIGSATDAFYGTIQVKAIIQNGKIADLQFLQHPDTALRSIAINEIAMPNLKQEAIQAQNASVAIITGATDTSHAFIQSLQSALDQAKS